MKMAIVTGCVGGVAHSKMAMKQLSKEAEKRGFQVVAEENGAHQSSRKLTEADIADVDVVLIATAIAIPEIERFSGKRIHEVEIHKAVMKPAQVVAEAAALVD